MLLSPWPCFTFLIPFFLISVNLGIKEKKVNVIQDLEVSPVIYIGRIVQGALVIHLLLVMRAKALLL